MPWRVIAYGNVVWRVAAVAERRLHALSWRPVLSFRGTSGKVRGGSTRARFPFEATSRSALFLQVEQIPGTAPANLLARRVV